MTTYRNTFLPGVLHITRPAYADARGWFMEAWTADPTPFTQGNLSFSHRDVLRGLHLQHPHGQGKLVQAVSGRIWDVAVDVRQGSPTYLKWTGALLADPSEQLYIPPGFAHGFYALTDAVVAYVVTDRYHPASELTIRWDDPAIGILWPSQHPTLSVKDAEAPSVADLLPRLPVWAPVWGGR